MSLRQLGHGGGGLVATRVCLWPFMRSWVRIQLPPISFRLTAIPKSKHTWITREWKNMWNWTQDLSIHKQPFKTTRPLAKVYWDAIQTLAILVIICSWLLNLSHIVYLKYPVGDLRVGPGRETELNWFWAIDFYLLKYNASKMSCFTSAFIVGPDIRQFILIGFLSGAGIILEQKTQAL